MNPLDAKLLKKTQLLAVEETALKIMDLLVSFGTREKQEDVFEHCRCAVMLYAIEWNEKDVADWQWPFMELETRDPFASGMNPEPWSCLLRRAWELAGKPKNIHYERIGR